MSATSFASAIALAATLTAGMGVTAAQAQSFGLPAEFPPASYDGSQYVDSRGCAFVRAGMAGAVRWVPRVGRSREQLCNFQPTNVAGSGPAADPLAGVPIITVDAQPAPVTPPAATPTVAAPPVEALPPRLPTARSAPQPAPAPAPARAAPVQVASPVVVAAPPPPPRRITLAEACSGRFGVQPGFISATTRQPIDCGPAPRTAALPTGSDRAAPRGVPMAAGPLRLTLAQACARQDSSGQTLINAATGRPIACAAPVRITVAQTHRDTGGAACGIGGVTLANGYAVRCGPQVQSPSGGSTAATAPVVTAMAPPTPAATGTVSTRSTRPLIGAGPVPASNQRGASVITVPQGYARVWDDGRINPQRGLPKVQATVSSRSVPPAAVQAPATAAGHRYVQVGTFGEPANAARLVARLQAAGLPVASATSGGLKTIAAGPFRSPADLTRALGVVRGMGFADAYPRR